MSKDYMQNEKILGCIWEYEREEEKRDRQERTATKKATDE